MHTGIVMKLLPERATWLAGTMGFEKKFSDSVIAILNCLASVWAPQKTGYLNDLKIENSNSPHVLCPLGTIRFDFLSFPNTIL